MSLRQHSETLSLASNTAAGSALKLTSSAPIAFVSDSLGNTYVPVEDAPLDEWDRAEGWVEGDERHVCAAQNILGGPTTVTVTFAKAVDRPKLSVKEYR